MHSRIFMVPLSGFEAPRIPRVNWANEAPAISFQHFCRHRPAPPRAKRKPRWKILSRFGNETLETACGF
jgi:hypothetical protein